MLVLVVEEAVAAIAAAVGGTATVMTVITKLIASVIIMSCYRTWYEQSACALNHKPEYKLSFNIGGRVRSSCFETFLQLTSKTYLLVASVQMRALKFQPSHP